MAGHKISHYLAANILRHGGVLSDEQYKALEEAEPMGVARAIIALGKPYSADELELLDSLLGDDNKYQYNVRDAGMWKDDVLNGYMKHIRNYFYKYKPEARQIDSAIDPDEQHIGPMAQDIEEVNPACINETPEGVKTVDTGRLALMNAGAIAELAREVASLKGGR